MKSVLCYELFRGIALKNHAFAVRMIYLSHVCTVPYLCKRIYLTDVLVIAMFV